MTNTIAFWLLALILIALAADWYYRDSEGLLFLAQKGLDLIQWMAFWR